MDSRRAERRRESKLIPRFTCHYLDAVKNNSSKSADKNARKISQKEKDKTWPSRMIPPQYVVQSPYLYYCYTSPRSPLRRHTMVERRLASPFARGTCLPRLTCFLSQIHPEAIQAIFSDDPARQLEATRGIRKLLSKKDNPPIDRIIASGVVPRFVEFLAGPRAALQVS